MKKTTSHKKDILDQNEHTNDINAFSRRTWLARFSLAAVGAGMMGTKAIAAPASGNNTADERMMGARTYNIRDFGAKGDGKATDTLAVQAAIDACHRDQGGTVLVPAGDFIIGTLALKSNVTL